jgi:hypothetical protein
VLPGGVQLLLNFAQLGGQLAELGQTFLFAHAAVGIWVVIGQPDFFAGRDLEGVIHMFSLLDGLRGGFRAAFVSLRQHGTHSFVCGIFAGSAKKAHLVGQVTLRKA